MSGDARADGEGPWSPRWRRLGLAWVAATVPLAMAVAAFVDTPDAYVAVLTLLAFGPYTIPGVVVGLHAVRGAAPSERFGGASAAAAELAPTHAPELKLSGAYVGAPAADLRQLATTLDGSFYAGFLLFALLGIDAAYSEVDLTVLANAEGDRIMTGAKTVCTFDAVFRYAFRQSSTLTVANQPVSAFLGIEPFNRIVNENRVGTLRPTAPTLIEHSALDDVLPQAQGKQLGKDWCAKGANVQFKDIPVFLPFLVHLSAASTAATNAANWLDGRFRGTAATPNCGTF